MLIFAAALTAATFVLFAWAWLRRRSLFLLPSTWILLLSTLIYVVPATVFFDQIEDMSPYAVTALAYCSLVTSAGLLTSLVLGRPPLLADLIPAAGRQIGPDRALTARALRWTMAALTLVMAWYLSNVPLSATGLYGILFDPQHSAQLREESLKLIDSRGLQYVYLIGFSALSPFAFALMLTRAAELRSVRRWALVASVMAALVFYLLITGARIGLVNLAMTGLLFAFLRNRLEFGLKPLLAAVVVILAVPILMSFLREQGRNEATALEYVEAIGERIFLLPLLISGWFVEYAEAHGPVGLLAAVGLGDNGNWSNLIALEFLGRKEAVTIETVTTPTAFFFSNYLYFGWMGVLPSLLALQLIDLPMRRLRRIGRPLRLPLAATFLFFAVIFVQSGFGVTLISHGYLLLALLVMALPLARERHPLLST